MSIMHFGSTANLFTGSVTSDSNIASGQIVSTRDTTAGIGTSTSGITFEINGESNKTVTAIDSSDSVAISVYDLTTWWSSQPVASVGNNYEIFAAINSEVQNGTGIASKTGVFGVWTSLATAQNWETQLQGDNDNGDYSLAIDFSIRDTATQTLQATGTISLNTNVLGI